MISQNKWEMEDVERFTVCTALYNADRHASICTTAVAKVDVIITTVASFSDAATYIAS